MPYERLFSKFLEVKVSDVIRLVLEDFEDFQSNLECFTFRVCVLAMIDISEATVFYWMVA